MMKKIVVTVIGILAVLGLLSLMKSKDPVDAEQAKAVEHVEPEQRAVTPKKPEIVEAVDSFKAVFEETRRDASGRILLPNPERMQAVNSQTIPEILHFLFGWGGQDGGYQKRVRLVRQLPRDLSFNEVSALVEFLYMQPDQVGLTEQDYNGVGDAVMEKIESQQQMHPDYTDHLVLIYYDEAYSEMWRDYCLQHVGSAYRRVAQWKRPVLRQLYDDATASGSVMAGTALLAMRNSVGGGGISSGDVRSSALAVADDPAFRDSSRLTAMLVASELGSPEALELAREIVDSRGLTAHFRVAAIASIGMQGNSADLELLQKYAQSSDFRFRMAAEAALKKLQGRMAAQM